MNCRL